MDFIAAGEETASDLWAAPKSCLVRRISCAMHGKGIDFLFAPVLGCENYKGSWQPCCFQFLIKSVLKDMNFFNFDKPEFSVRRFPGCRESGVFRKLKEFPFLKAQKMSFNVLAGKVRGRTDYRYFWNRIFREVFFLVT